MRVRHVLTYVGIDGAFGGPTTVARTQVAELIAGGIDATLWAGWDGEKSSEPGVQAERLFIAHRLSKSFAGTFSFQLLLKLWASSKSFDITHVHLARDLITLPAALLLHVSKQPYVVQTHGMVMSDVRGVRWLIDAVLTRRILKGAKAVLCVNLNEARDMQEFGVRQANVLQVAVAIDVAPCAHVRSQGPANVLFLGRLHTRKRVMLFAQAAVAFTRLHPGRATFSAIGPDEGDLDNLRSYIREKEAEAYLSYEGAIAPSVVVSRMCQSQVMVVCSEAESFGMSALEALSTGMPIVVTDRVALADIVGRDNLCLTVAEDDPTAIAKAVARTLDEIEIRSRAAIETVEQGPFAHEHLLSTLRNAYGRE